MKKPRDLWASPIIHFVVSFKFVCKVNFTYSSFWLRKTFSKMVFTISEPSVALKPQVEAPQIEAPGMKPASNTGPNAPQSEAPGTKPTAEKYPLEGAKTLQPETTQPEAPGTNSTAGTDRPDITVTVQPEDPETLSNSNWTSTTTTTTTKG